MFFKEKDYSLSLSVSICLCLSVCLPPSLSVCLSLFHCHISLRVSDVSLFVSGSALFACLFLYPSVFVCTSVFVCLSLFCMSLRSSLSLPVSLCLCIADCLSHSPPPTPLSVSTKIHPVQPSLTLHSYSDCLGCLGCLVVCGHSRCQQAAQCVIVLFARSWPGPGHELVLDCVHGNNIVFKRKVTIYLRLFPQTTTTTTTLNPTLRLIYVECQIPLHNRRGQLLTRASNKIMTMSVDVYLVSSCAVKYRLCLAVTCTNKLTTAS